MTIDWDQIKILTEEYIDSCREFEKKDDILQEFTQERAAAYKTMCNARAALEQAQFHPEKVNGG